MLYDKKTVNKTHLLQSSAYEPRWPDSPVDLVEWENSFAVRLDQKTYRTVDIVLPARRLFFDIGSRGSFRLVRIQLRLVVHKHKYRSYILSDRSMPRSDGIMAAGD
jgi:hypothetical protein